MVTTLGFQFTLMNYNFIGVKTINYEKSFFKLSDVIPQVTDCTMTESTMIPTLFYRGNACLSSGSKKNHANQLKSLSQLLIR